MRILPKDILDEMKTRFDLDYNSSLKILEEFLTDNKYLEPERIIRCVVFLADNGLESFKSYLESAKGDPRDVMWWAEYDNHDSLDDNPRIRNFSKTFQENGI